MDPFQDPILATDLGGEMGTEKGGLGRRDQKGLVIDLVGEVGAHLSDVMGGDGEAIEGGGDEGDGAAEGFS